MQLGRALPWTLLAVVGAASDVCSCDCCSTVESHADPSGATVVTCALIEASDDRFLSASRHGRGECQALCTRGVNDNVLWNSGSEVDQQRFCADECTPGSATPDLCTPGGAPTRDGNGKANEVVHPVAFHAVARKAALPADEWASVKDDAHDVGFRTEELSTAVAERVTAAKASSELAEKVKVESNKKIPETFVVAAKAQEKAGVAADAMRASEDWLAQAREAAGQAAASVRSSTLAQVVEEAHDTAKVEAKEAAVKLEADMKKQIPEAKKAAMKPFEDAMARAAAIAGDYVKAGDGLTGASLGAQLAAGQQLSSASQFSSLGETAKAQSYMRDAHNGLGLAAGMASAANGMYDNAAKITASLGGYMGQAAAAAYHAEVMLNPDAPPPPPPTV